VLAWRPPFPVPSRAPSCGAHDGKLGAQAFASSSYPIRTGRSREMPNSCRDSRKRTTLSSARQVKRKKNPIGSAGRLGPGKRTTCYCIVHVVFHTCRTKTSKMKQARDESAGISSSSVPQPNFPMALEGPTSRMHIDMCGDGGRIDRPPLVRRTHQFPPAAFSRAVKATTRPTALSPNKTLFANC
jgi:hypothetical protein